MARALLATDVLAVGADTVGAETGIAAVAAATNPHANGAIDPLDGHVGGRLPLTRFEGQAIFGEQNTRSILLNGTPVGDQGGNGDTEMGFPHGRTARAS